MAKRKKETTIDDLAMMVGKGFGSMHEEMRLEFDKVYGKFDEVNMRLSRIERKDIHREDEMFEVKNRLKVVEKRLRIKAT